MSALSDLFNPQKRYADARLRQAAMGAIHLCPTCGATDYHREHTTCPVCLTAWDGTPTTQRQVVRTYTGGGLDKAFAADLARMSRAGWQVTSQTYGGMQGGPTLLARHKPTQLTVIYERPQ